MNAAELDQKVLNALDEASAKTSNTDNWVAPREVQMYMHLNLGVEVELNYAPGLREPYFNLGPTPPKTGTVAASAAVSSRLAILAKAGQCERKGTLQLYRPNRGGLRGAGVMAVAAAAPARGLIENLM